jgi:hypothetical protein
MGIVPESLCSLKHAFVPPFAQRTSSALICYQGQRSRIRASGRKSGGSDHLSHQFSHETPSWENIMQNDNRAALPASFRRVAWSNLFAQFSEQIALAAAPLAAVLLLSASAADTAWLQTAQTLPFLLLSIPAGLLVDRASRRGLMVSSEVLRTLSLAAILALLASGLLNLQLLVIFGFSEPSARFATVSQHRR